ncbi:MAG: CRISPR-associated endonuclease Cas2 [Phycisphaeraceae bacterium]|nr:CRISPR-associated endonuclease Cas2 [Phycisphaeraceae bacterium]
MKTNPITHRRHYVITYDVSDDKRRNRIFKTLYDHGDHVQFSVFVCQLTKRERVDLMAKLTHIVNHKEDQIMLIDLGTAQTDCRTLIQTVGKAYYPLTSTFIV